MMETQLQIWVIGIFTAIGWFSGFYQETRVRILFWKGHSKVQIKQWHHLVWQDAVVFYSDNGRVCHAEKALLFAKKLESQGCRILYTEGME
jgi:hypothetical protein